MTKKYITKKDLLEMLEQYEMDEEIEIDISGTTYEWFDFPYDRVNILDKGIFIEIDTVGWD